MYVCVCNAVTERHVADAVGRGATRMRDLREDLGVTAECGRCASCARQCLKDALEARSAAESWSDKALHALSGVFPLELETQS